MKKVYIFERKFDSITNEIVGLLSDIINSQNRDDEEKNFFFGIYSLISMGNSLDLASLFGILLKYKQSKSHNWQEIEERLNIQVVLKLES